MYIKEVHDIPRGDADIGDLAAIFHNGEWIIGIYNADLDNGFNYEVIIGDLVLSIPYDNVVFIRKVKTDKEGGMLIGKRYNDFNLIRKDFGRLEIRS